MVEQLADKHLVAFNKRELRDYRAALEYAIKMLQANKVEGLQNIVQQKSIEKLFEMRDSLQPRAS